VEAAPSDTLWPPVNADSLEAPDGTRVAISDARLVVPSAQGVYFFRRANRRVGALVVNPELRESDRTPWTADDWSARVADADVQMASEPARAVEMVYARAGGRSVAWPLVLVALLALLAEALIARGVLSTRAPAAGRAA
jgi:hypothetical protein